MHARRLKQGTFEVNFYRFALNFEVDPAEQPPVTYPCNVGMWNRRKVNNVSSGLSFVAITRELFDIWLNQRFDMSRT